MDVDSLIAKLKESTERLRLAVEQVPEAHFNTRPGPGQWSTGDVVEHLSIIEDFTVRILAGAARKVERDPFEKLHKIRTTFESGDKLTAGSPVEPSDQEKDKADILEKLSYTRMEMMKIARERDFSEECLDFKHMLFGYLTRAEWIGYHVHHAARHIRQIEGTAAHLAS